MKTPEAVSGLALNGSPRPRSPKSKRFLCAIIGHSDGKEWSDEELAIMNATCERCGENKYGKVSK